MYSLIIITDFVLIFIIAALNSFLKEGTPRLYSDTTKLKSASLGSTVLTSLSHQYISLLFFSSTVASQTVCINNQVDHIIELKVDYDRQITGEWGNQ